MNKILLLTDAMDRTEGRPLIVQELGLVLRSMGEPGIAIAFAGATLEEAGLIRGEDCDCPRARGPEGCDTRFIYLTDAGREQVAALKAQIKEATGTDLDDFEQVKAAALRTLQEENIPEEAKQLLNLDELQTNLETEALEKKLQRRSFNIGDPNNN
jgi:hypothetical protein